MNPEVTVIMPAYNLQHIIVDSIREVCRVLDGFVESYEIIVIDDGSEDDTYKAALSLADGRRIKVLRNNINKGKGFTLKKGSLYANGEYTVFLDADMEIDPRQIFRYVSALKHVDMVIASKRHPASTYEAPLIRKILSLGFNILVKLLTGIKVSDTQTGCKAFKTEALKTIMHLIVVKRYAFDVELLIVAKLLNLKIIELPVKVKLSKRFSFKSILRMLLDLLGITYRLRVVKWYQKKIKNLRLNLKSIHNNSM
ncbi:MAG: glycosyltransferase [Candidatus Methanomethylicia archaeon]